MIEDGSEEFVYFDERNENRRNIVKSILKSIIGEYELGDRAEEEEYFQEMMMKYKESMRLSLKKVFSNHKGSIDQVVKVLKGLELKIEDRFYDTLLWKLCLESRSADELEL